MMGSVCGRRGTNDTVRRGSRRAGCDGRCVGRLQRCRSGIFGWRSRCWRSWCDRRGGCLAFCRRGMRRRLRRQTAAGGELETLLIQSCILTKQQQQTSAGCFKHLLSSTNNQRSERSCKHSSSFTPNMSGFSFIRLQSSADAALVSSIISVREHTRWWKWTEMADETNTA